MKTQPAASPTKTARYFRCHCCGNGFRSDKPQDPERDNGFGTCTDCHETVAEDRVRCLRDPETPTLETARARLLRFA